MSLSVAQGQQRKIASYEKYVKQYSSLAIQHDNKYNIPASITLAQAILESGAGQARLAKEANNHFGIKCHADWKGGRIYHDDKRNECFRKYKNVAESYEDHSVFLVSHSRYAKLFKLDKKDYRGWAKGLQDCGYATDRGYANKLISVIETYQLYEYDRGGKSGKKTASTTSPKSTDKKTTTIKLSRNVYKTHGLIYVIAQTNDTFDEIAKGLGFSSKKLAKYNEVPVDFPLQRGDIVYLEKKKKKANKPYYNHKVQIGESMHSISQRYGIQMKQLYKINSKDADYVPTEGDMLKLR